MGSRNEWGRTNVTKCDMLMMSDVKVENIWAIMIALMMAMLMMILAMMKRWRWWWCEMMMRDNDDDDVRWCQRRSADRSPPGAWRTKLPHNLQTIIIVVVIIVVVVVVVDAVVVVIIILISKVLRSQILNSGVVKSSSYTLLEFLEFSDPGIPRHFFFVTSKVCLW